MNWEKFSEKLSKDKKGEYVIVFCDPADLESPFVQRKITKYEAQGFRVVVKNPDDTKKNRNKNKQRT